MALFFFDVYDGRSDADDVGTELPDVASARSEGMALAGQIIRDAARDGEIYEAWHLNVRDDTGVTLFRMDFHVSQPPVVGQAFPAFNRWRLA